MEKQPMTALCGGVLGVCFEKVRQNFYDKIDEMVHAATYAGDHDLNYAEPEFTGKFMDICACYYESEGDDRALRKGMAVVDSIERNIRADGYLGCLGEGNELKMFSVWNQAFTLYGLTRMYEATGEKRIFELIRRAADWIVDTFSENDAPDILDALNKGSQHISCFFAICRTYAVTGDRKYLEFIKLVLDYCETTDMNLLSFDDILKLRSQKGIEMLVIYLGILQYGKMANDERAVEAARRYFDQVMKTQIRNTGNGTICEEWMENGNAPRLMSTEEKPNETCVAVGIVEMALALFYDRPCTEYLDVIERVMFNHMVGSLEHSGSDLAYYQGNYGRKIYRTAGGMYQCCRYRGFTLFSYLPQMIYHYDNDVLVPMIYTPSVFETEGLRCRLATDYPVGGKLKFEVTVESVVTLRLRIPVWCEDFMLHVDNKAKDATPQDGYIDVTISKGMHEVMLVLRKEVKVMHHIIEDKPYLSVEYGPLLMAHDTHFGGELWQTLSKDVKPCLCYGDEKSLLRMEAEGMTLVDFVSAGGNDPENDLYTVFIPENKKGSNKEK